MRKKIYAVIDTETAGNIGFPLIYDLAVSICDKKGNIIEQGNWVIKEIYYNNHLMDNAFYGSKRPIYNELIQQGKMEVVSFRQAMYYLNKLLEKHKVDVLTAYNLSFDLRALRATAKKTHLIWKNAGKELPIFWRDYQIQDIWSLACETLYQTFNFERFIIENDKFTEKGNPLTNAEIGFQYVVGDKGFVEDHMALSDTAVEVAILSRCLQMKKGYTHGFGKTWQHVAKRFKKAV